jgi:hypothetical protein
MRWQSFRKIRLGIAFWLLLLILGALFWLGSGYFTNHQLKQFRPLSGPIKLE